LLVAYGECVKTYIYVVIFSLILSNASFALDDCPEGLQRFYVCHIANNKSSDVQTQASIDLDPEMKDLFQDVAVCLREGKTYLLVEWKNFNGLSKGAYEVASSIRSGLETYTTPLSDSEGFLDLIIQTATIKNENGEAVFSSTLRLRYVQDNLPQQKILKYVCNK